MMSLKFVLGGALVEVDGFDLLSTVRHGVARGLAQFRGAGGLCDGVGERALDIEAAAGEAGGLEAQRVATPGAPLRALGEGRVDIGGDLAIGTAQGEARCRVPVR